MSLYRIFVVGCLLSISFGQVASANSIRDGSFETPHVPPGTFIDVHVGSQISAHWTVVGPQGTNVSIISCPYTEGGYNFVAEAGRQFVDLTGDGSNQAEGVEQTVPTVVGKKYKLSFWVGNVVGGGFGTSSTVNVYVNGNLLMSATNSGGSTTISWQHFVHAVTATTTSTTIDFINGDPTSDNFNGLDAVNLSP